MKKNPFLFYFNIIILLIILFYPNLCLAQQNDLIELETKNTTTLASSENSLESLIEKTRQYYLEKNFPQAILLLSKIILRDPETPEILSIIENISSEESLSPEERKGLLQMEDLLTFMQNLNQKKSYFQTKKEMLYLELMEKGFSGYFLNEEMVSAETKAWQENLSADSMLSEKDLEARGPLNVAIKVLQAEQNEINSRLIVLTKQYNRLKELNKDSTGIILKKQDIRELIAQKKNDIYKQQISLIRKKTDEFEQKARSNQEKMDQLTQQIIDTALKLSEKDQEFDRQAQQLASLNDHIQELESRFELRERILAEKDNSFESLKNSLKEIKQNASLQKEEINKILSSKDESLVELNGILQIYKEKLGEFSKEIKQKTFDIGALESQLAHVQKQLSEKDLIIKKAQDQIKQMKDQIREVQNKFSSQGT